MGILLLGAAPSAPGLAGINLGPADLVACNVINIFKACTLGVTNSADAARLDDDGYLTSTPTGAITMAFSSPANGGTTFVGETYRLRWPSTIQFKMTFTSAMTKVGTETGCTVTGGTGVGNTTIETTSGGGYVDFIVGVAQPSVSFPPTGTYSRSGGEIALYRVSDEADYLAGRYWTREYVNRLKELKPAYIRPMGMVNAGGNNYNGEVAWSDRMPLASMTWGFTRIIPNALVGNITGTDTYSCGAATNTPATWTDGEVFIGYVENTNTLTTCTINVNGRGAKDMVSRSTATLANSGTGSSRVAVGYGTFRYDGVLDKVLYSPGIYQCSPPYEAQIQLANLVNTDLWFTFPYQVNDDYVTQQAILARDTLNRKAYYAYANEVWHNTWPQTGWAASRGVACGWVSSGNQHTYGWYGLRTAIMFKDLIPAVYGSSLAAKAIRVHEYQGGGFLTIVDTRMNGTMLTTTIGNSTYDTISGNRNFNTFPDRPVDLADSIAFAPYTGGTNFSRGADLLITVTVNNRDFYQALIDAWVANDTATTRTMISADIHDGRLLVQNVTAVGTTFTTPSNHHLGLSAAFTGSVGASFTGTQSGTDLTASSVTDVISIGDVISGTGVSANTTIVSQTSGTPGGAGVYVTSLSGTASSTAITAISNKIQVTSISSGLVEAGQQLAGGTLSTTSSVNIIATNLSGSGVGEYSFVGTARRVASQSITSSWSPDIYFDVAGGTAYSGVTTRVPYRVLSTPSTTTFTAQPYVGGINTGSAVNAGTAGSGTMNVGYVGRNILYTSYWMPAFGEAQATTYDSARTGAGMSPIRVDWYEGNLEPAGPSATECAFIGLTGYTSAEAATYIAAALDDWRFSTNAKETMKLYYEAMTGLDAAYPDLPHAVTTSQLVLPGPGLYSMTSGPLPTSTPYQTYYGFKEFNEENPQV